MKLYTYGINQEFLDYIKPFTQTYARLYNLPEEFIISVACLECGWKKPIYNNFFNIKSWDNENYYEKETLEYDKNGKPYYYKAKFKIYNTIDDSFIDFCDKITKERRYNKAMKYLNTKIIEDKLLLTDLYIFVILVNEAGYSTDEFWFTKVIDIVNRLYYKE
jgi:flagellum-specific peptidoglycan hydrolase FlgJ